MDVAKHFPGIPGSAYIDWRARRLEDPVARLRYLRQATQRRTRVPVWLRPRREWARTALALCWVFSPVMTVSDTTVRENALLRPAALATAASVTAASVTAGDPNVWLVEKRTEFEIYSNGLRVETRYATGQTARRYLPLDRASWNPVPAEHPADPVGIVFHTTESHLAPFAPEETRRLLRLGQGVLEYVRSQRAYHYVVDRFGRVFRVVAETDGANHAGWSIWADEKRAYVNLNQSFLGVAFEAQSHADDEAPTINAAQMHAARVLTEMLRSKYRIKTANCVTHAQVSVNPDNWKIGAHTDWAGNFPFAQLGLPENYKMPPSSITDFGFRYDDVFVKMTGPRLWQGLLMAEDQARLAASAHGQTMAAWRAALRRRYREAMETIDAKERGEDGRYEKR